MSKIIIIGGKGTATNIADHIVNAKEVFGIDIELLGFAIDDAALGDSINGYPILCKTVELTRRFSHEDVKYIFALYKPEKMKERVALLKGYGILQEKFAIFIHPSAYVSKSAKVGLGTVILSNVSINNNTHLGNFNIINSGVVIEHDSVIQGCNFISASSCIGAQVHIGTGAFVGLNSTIREGVKVGEYAFIGMGSNVLRDVQPESVVFGNPARIALC